MKRILTALFLCTALIVTAQETGDNDEQPEKVPNDFLDLFDSSRSERAVQTRTKSILAIGWNQALGDGNGIGDDYRFWGSGIFEFGVEFSTRISPNDKLRLNYGLSLQTQSLRINNNRQFETIDDITSLQPVGFDVEKSKFQQSTLIVPVHLEIGRGEVKTYEDDITRINHDDSFVFGIGGYVGINGSTNQFLKFERNGRDISNRLYNDFEMEDFVYGLSAYAGAGSAQIFVKYGLNTIFKNSPVDQQYASIGFRFR
jgi:hypothetical protein